MDSAAMIVQTNIRKSCIEIKPDLMIEVPAGDTVSSTLKIILNGRGRSKSNSKSITSLLSPRLT